MASCLQAQLARVSVVLNGAGDLVLADACKGREDENTARRRSAAFQPHCCQQKDTKTQHLVARCITDELLDLVLLVRGEEGTLARVLFQLGRRGVGIGALRAQGGRLVSAALRVCRQGRG